MVLPAHLPAQEATPREARKAQPGAPVGLFGGRPAWDLNPKRGFPAASASDSRPGLEVIVARFDLTECEWG